MSEQHVWIDTPELSDETKAALRAQAVRSSPGRAPSR